MNEHTFGNYPLENYSQDDELIADIDEQFRIALRFVEFRYRLHPERPEFTLDELAERLTLAGAALPEEEEARQQLLSDFVDDIDGVFYEQLMSGKHEYGYRMYSRTERGVTEYYPVQVTVPQKYRKAALQESSNSLEVDEPPAPQSVQYPERTHEVEQALNIVRSYPEARKKEQRALLAEALGGIGIRAAEGILEGLVSSGRIHSGSRGGYARYATEKRAGIDVPDRQQIGAEQLSGAEKELAIPILDVIKDLTKSRKMGEKRRTGAILREYNQRTNNPAQRLESREDLNRILRKLKQGGLVILQQGGASGHDRFEAGLASVEVRNRLRTPEGRAKLQEVIDLLQ